jgi:hypothetical protein
VAELLNKFVNIENYSDFSESVSNMGDKPSVFLKYRNKRIQIL